MACPLSIVSAVVPLVWNSLRLLADIFTFFRLCLRSPAAVAAENLFLRKQLGLYIERKTKPRRATHSVRFTLAGLSRFFDWRNTPIAPRSCLGYVNWGNGHGNTGNCCTLRSADGNRHSRRRFPVVQKPVLGTAGSEYRNRLGIRSFLLEILEASVSKARIGRVTQFAAGSLD